MITGLPLAAATTSRVFVATRVPSASAPRYSVSRCANAAYSPSMCITGSYGAAISPSNSDRTVSSRQAGSQSEASSREIS